MAAAKSRFSAVLAQVEAGEEVVITWRGIAIARIVAEPARLGDGFDLQELFQFTNAQPMHEGPDAGNFMAELSCAALRAIDGVLLGHLAAGAPTDPGARNPKGPGLSLRRRNKGPID